MRRTVAEAILDGYGDSALGEWMEDRQIAFHLRRRLSASEAHGIGEAVDLRGNPEARQRFERIRSAIPLSAVALALEELREAEGEALTT